MPILQDKVEITLTSNVIKYYEEMGYDIPHRYDKKGRWKVPEGTKIIVDINHLPKGSGVPVYMKCDGCGFEFYRPWRDYIDRSGAVYCKNCSGVLRSGENAYNWNADLSIEDRINGRDYPEYHDFVKRVLERDGYACKVCGKKDDGLAVHHLNGFNWCVSERTDDNNGITLCSTCHNAFHSTYGRGSNRREQFEEWIGTSLDELGEGQLPTARKVICMDDGIVLDSAPATAKKYYVDRNSLYNVLNRKYRSLFGKHFLWYDEYEAMTKEELFAYMRWVLEK